MLINVRGTSGSGKSTIMFEFLNRFPKEELKNSKGKIMCYVLDVGLLKKVCIIGSYHTATGGLDGIPTQAEAAERALWAHGQGYHVLLEGLLASGAGPKGQLTIALESTREAIYGFLDTPLEVCLDRVRARRAAKGNDKPLNTANTTDKFYQVVSTYKSMKRDGYPVALIDHTRAYDHVMEILRASE